MSETQINTVPLNAWEHRLLSDWQHDFPLTDEPYAHIAKALGVTEQQVIEALTRLTQVSAISRVGAVVRPNTIGVSTLAAMAVPAEQLEAVAQLVNGYAEVNHNYEREHSLNLWFVATAPDARRLQAVLRDIAARTGIEVLPFPLLEDYHIDLGFELRL
jgi:siroheme decarboxylase